MWATREEMEDEMFRAKFLAVIFTFCCIVLVTSITLTIITNPGNIPEDREWDIQQDLPRPIMNLSNEEEKVSETQPRDSALSGVPEEHKHHDDQE